MKKKGIKFQNLWNFGNIGLTLNQTKLTSLLQKVFFLWCWWWPAKFHIFSQIFSIHYMMAICPYHHHHHRRCDIVHRNIESIKSPSYLTKCVLVCVCLIIIICCPTIMSLFIYIFFLWNGSFICLNFFLSVFNQIQPVYSQSVSGTCENKKKMRYYHFEINQGTMTRWNIFVFCLFKLNLIYLCHHISIHKTHIKTVFPKEKIWFIWRFDDKVIHFWIWFFFLVRNRTDHNNNKSQKRSKKNNVIT